MLFRGSLVIEVNTNRSSNLKMDIFSFTTQRQNFSSMECDFDERNNEKKEEKHEKEVEHDDFDDLVGTVPETENVWKVLSYVCGNKLPVFVIKNLRLVNRSFYRLFTRFLFFSPHMFHDILKKINMHPSSYDSNLRCWLNIETQMDDIIFLCKSNKEFEDAFKKWLTVAAANNLLETVEDALKKRRGTKENYRPKFRTGMRKLWRGTVGVAQTSAALVWAPLALLSLPLFLFERGSSTPVLSKAIEIGTTPFLKCAMGAIDSFDGANEPNVRRLDRYLEEKDICDCISRIAQRVENELL
jgi:hypothetical protein